MVKKIFLLGLVALLPEQLYGAERPPTYMELPAGCVDSFRNAKGVNVYDIFSYDQQIFNSHERENNENAHDYILKHDFSLGTPFFHPVEQKTSDLGLKRTQQHSVEDTSGSRQISGETLLTLARMVYQEARGQPEAHRRQVLWTTYHRFWYMEYFRNLSKHKDSMVQEAHMGYFLEQFSQPINPNWNLGAKYCRNYYYKNRSACSPQQIKDREALQNMKWEDIPFEYRQLAFKFALGLIPQPEPEFRALDFGNTNHTTCDDGLVNAFYMSHDTPEPIRYNPTVQKKRDGKTGKVKTVVNRMVHRFCRDPNYKIPDVEIIKPTWLECSFDKNIAQEKEAGKKSAANAARSTNSLLDIVTTTFNKTRLGKTCQEYMN